MPRGSNTELEIFLQLAFPWDDEHAGLFKSVTWSWGIDKDTKRPMFANYATQSYDDFIRLIETRALKPGTNTYVALGTQRMARIDKFSHDGFPKAIRKLENIVSFNTIYLDLDVKPGAYADTAEALKQLEAFRVATGLPPLSMTVLSGSGGVHAYWCVKEPMPVAAWSPLAVGLRDAALAYKLKFDPQVTVNAAGILRPPSSFNYKTKPRGRVQLLLPLSSGARYDYAELADRLGTVQSASISMAGGHGTAFTSNFTAGVAAPPAPPIDDVAINCGVVRDILARAGNGDREPLWNLALLLASFTADPVDAAHRLSSGDPRYVPADTDQKLAEKLNARGNGKLGWPACQSFAALHPACQSCPFFVQAKSPLNHVPTKPVAAQTINSLLLPDGYSLDNNHCVVTNVKDKDDNVFTVKVLGDGPLLDGALDMDNNTIAVRTAVAGIDAWKSIALSSIMLSSGAAAQALLNGAGFAIAKSHHNYARDFIVAWITKLQNLKRTIQPTAYGWGSGGFVFGEHVFRSGGQEVIYRGRKMEPNFRKEGTLEPWITATELIYGNPGLETIVATAFAAPLVELVSTASLVCSAYSYDSGVGKTTALTVAQAVWGHPRLGMSSYNDTERSVMKKVESLRNLPVYWDELHTKDSFESVVDLVFQITQGKGRAKLNRDSTQMDVSDFTTIFSLASNSRLTDIVVDHTIGTDAGALRVFEFEVKRGFGKVVSDVESRQQLLALDSNYGAAGAAYAAHLVKHHDEIKRSLVAMSKFLEQQHNMSVKERFWLMLLSTVMVGAAAANQAGLTRFDLKAMMEFLLATLDRLRSELQLVAAKTLVDGGSGEYALGVLNDMLADARARNLIVTDVIHYGMGRPVQPALYQDVTKLTDIWMQLGDSDGRIRAAKSKFDDWLIAHKYHPRQIIEGLEKHYYITPNRTTPVNKQAIGAGIKELGAVVKRQRQCYDFTPRVTPSGSNPGV